MERQRLKLLLVEDEEDDYLLMKMMMSKVNQWDIKLDWVSAFQPALETMVHNIHDIYLVDGRLGAADGLTLLQEAIRQGCKAPIIMLTGLGTYEMDVLAMQTGAADYLEKHNLSPVALERAIRYALERQKAEQALQESERLFRLLAQNSPDVIYIMDVTQQRVTYLNRSEFLGYSQGEFESIPAILEALHPDDRERVRQHWREVMSDGKFSGIGVIEYRVKDKYGEWQWLQSRETTLTMTSDGKPTQVLFTLTLITERKLAEEAVRLSESLYRSLFNQIGDAIFVHDEEGNILDVNEAACDRLGYSRDELTRMKTVDIDAPQYGAGFDERLKEQLRTGELSNIIGIHIARDGRQIPVHVNSRVIKYKGRDAVIAVVRDITELRRAEEREIELATEKARVKVLSDFIHDASHDFRTPLTAIGTSAYLLFRSPDKEKRQGYLDNIDHRIKQLTHLLDRLFYMSQVDSNLDLEIASLSLDAFFSEIYTRFISYAEEKNIRLEIQSGDDMPSVRADRQALAQAVGEIVDNALAFTHSGGVITISARVDGDSGVISLQDTGKGIPEAILPHIFKRLFRGDDARSTTRGAVGLGLSIAERIVDVHGGKIKVESREGEGSTFSVFLPLAL